MSTRLPGESVGCYHPCYMGYSPRIYVARPLKMKMHYKYELLWALKDTILHETQHAIDDKHGIGDVNYELGNVHNDAFYRRLAKLIDIFSTV